MAAANGLRVMASEVPALAQLVGALGIDRDLRGNPLQVFADQEVIYSTVYFPLSTLTVSATSRDAFSAVAGVLGQQGLPPLAAQSPAQTNWFGNPDGSTSLGQAFVGLDVGFSIYVATGGPTAAANQFKSWMLDATQVGQFGLSTTWTYTESGNNPRTLGTLYDYPYKGGIFAAGVSGTAAANTILSGAVQNGGPGSCGTPLAVPVIWKPLVSNKHAITLHNDVTFIESIVADGYDMTNAAIAVRMAFGGWRLTAQQ